MAEDQENEPSIEEILDSIRQIISDDEEEGAEEAPAAPEPEPTPEPEPEAAPAPDPEPASVEDEVPGEDFADILAAEEEDSADEEGMDIGFDEDEVVELTDVVEEASSAPEPAFVPVPEPEAAVDAQSEISKTIDTVLSENAEDITMTAFTQLAKKAAVDRSGSVSVEDIVREEIRPILRNWVDDHLPRMLERLLQEELDKIAKRALDD